MLKFKMVDNNDDFVSYRYFPEGKEDSGKLTIRKNDGEIVEYTVANTDEFKRYFYHMIQKIEEFVKNKQFLNEGLISWY